MGPRSIPIFRANMNQANARPSVALLQLSDTMIRTVKTLPAKLPAKQRKTIICSKERLMPNSMVKMLRPVRLMTSTGFLPKQSDIRPEGTISYNLTIILS